MGCGGTIAEGGEGGVCFGLLRLNSHHIYIFDKQALYPHLAVFCCNSSHCHLWLHKECSTIATFMSTWFTIHNAYKDQKPNKPHQLWSCLEFDLPQWAGYHRESREEGARTEWIQLITEKQYMIECVSLQRKWNGAWASGLQVNQYEQELRACRGTSEECQRQELTVNMTPETAAGEAHTHAETKRQARTDPWKTFKPMSL